ncbi:MAG: tetratricopeptide repeat protein [Sulfurimicrobium sp.]|nr:tetratricopeptide repeat protein [Sulfurimicrobium sp.]MDP1703393.1 tetratricopeptide repeat protein [Sulfurimicrobium sp.]MDP2198390.1 tetratricopeptide repeat protein [Sulfurimicrobium sp.]MDP3686130.1 tetratricopeptide repeat protein [Sulfurimicrobium sp.]
MSLINQMLQDLEQRKADGNTTAAQVRAVPKTDGPSFVRWGGWLSLLLAVTTAGAYWIYGMSANQSNPPAPLPAITGSPDTAALKPLAQQDYTPSVLQLAPELSFLPSTLPGAPETERSATATIQPEKKEDIPPTVQENPQPAVAEIKKQAVTIESPQPAGINKEIRQLTPQQRAENTYRQAYANLQQGRMGEAEENLRQALQFEPRHAAARQALAALLVESRRLERAEQVLQQGLELQQGNTGYATTLARVQVERGNVAAALTTLQRNPPAGENAEYHGFLAALLQRSERHKEAIDHYLAALRSNPGMGPWLLGLGISLQADGQTAKAAEIFRHARQSGSLSPELQAFAEQRLKALQ